MAWSSGSWSRANLGKKFSAICFLIPVSAVVSYLQSPDQFILVGFPPPAALAPRPGLGLPLPASKSAGPVFRAGTTFLTGAFLGDVFGGALGMPISFSAISFFIFAFIRFLPS